MEPKLEDYIRDAKDKFSWTDEELSAIWEIIAVVQGEMKNKIIESIKYS